MTCSQDRCSPCYALSLTLPSGGCRSLYSKSAKPGLDFQVPNQATLCPLGNLAHGIETAAIQRLVAKELCATLSHYGRLDAILAAR